MSLFVYISEQAKKDAIAHNFFPQIQKFAGRVEKRQTTDSFDRFPQPHIKKRFGKIRLLAGERFLGEDVVICFLRILIRGSAEYISFLETREIPKGDRIRSEVTDEALIRFVESRQETPDPPPPPSNTESQFLFAALSDSANQYDDYVCCETELWFDRIKDPQFANRISQFQEPVFGTFGESTGKLTEVRIPGAPEFGFLFRHFPKTKTVLLFSPFRGNPDRSEIEARYPDLVKPSHTELSHETILRQTRQAYPLAVLDNADAWFEIEKDKEGNIALSYEEVDVLQSPRKSDEGFPLFINGRAGSGKSTILQYLFSDYLYFYFKNEIDGPAPIFFACNDDLITQSKKSISRILAAKHRLDKGSGDILASPSNTAEFKNAFANFHSWLLGLCEPWDYDPQKRIDYSAFKKWWARRFANEAAASRLYNADVSWHVIRSYIKGSNLDDFLDPQDYSEIPERQKSVSPETYQLVFDRVWSKYSADQERHGLWDDQDLARKALSENRIVPKRPVVFCDEAQDFTRVDLEVLLHLSLFSNRTLQGYQVLKVPFAFAGDPFQTLNPTGFRWEATKAHFVEKFVRRHRDTQAKTDLNYCELTYNYRSTRNIVLFCNTLQLVRSVLFDIPEIKPQIPWFEERDSAMPVYFDKADLDVTRRLSQESEIRIIVPCEEGDESDYLAQHPELDEFVEKDDSGVPKNVVSPMRVKGLEFKRVVLFGFGDACPKELLNVLRKPQDAPLSGDRSIDAQYFLNRLYVAASRPRRRLFIVDSHVALTEFWTFACDENVRDEFALLAGSTDVWGADKVGLLTKGHNESWEEDREDAIETADKLASDGRLRKDRVLLRQAAQSYRNGGNHQLAQQCRAEALEIEEEYLRAADIYVQLEQFGRAVKACWKEGPKGMDRILELAPDYAHLQGRIEHSAAAFIRSSHSFDDGLALLKDIQNYLEDSTGRLEIVTEPAWKEAMIAIKEKLMQIGDNSPGTWKVVSSYFEKITQAGLAVGPLPLGELYFRADDLTKANFLWSSVWNTLSDDQRRPLDTRYYQSQAFVTEYPEKLLVLEKLLGNEKLDAPATIVEAYRLSGTAKLKDEHWQVIAKALIAKSENQDLLNILQDLSGESILLLTIEYFVRVGVDQGVNKVFSKLVNLWDGNSEWTKILSLWNRNRRERMELPARGKITWEEEVNCVVAEAAAHSTTLRTEENSVRTSISENLSQAFLGGFGWANRIHPIVVGAALESGGLFRHILPFYERVEANLSFHSSTRISAGRRWLKTKEGQLRLEGSRRSTRIALEEKMASLRVSDLTQISDFPNLAELPPVFAEVSAHVEEPLLSRVKKMFVNAQELEKPFGALRISVSEDRKRINFENTESFEQGTVFPATRRVIIDGVEISRDQAAVDLATWGYSIEFSAESLVVKDGQGREISVTLRPGPSTETA